MIYEIRTYNLRTGNLEEYWKRFGEKIPERAKRSQIGGHWYTEAGPLNQMVAIWLYDDIEQRASIRREVESGPNPIWPPDTSSLIVSMTSEIFFPAPFMPPFTERKLGPLYELRLYTYQQELIPGVLEAWGQSIAERETLSPLVGCWYKESGGPGNFAHMWAYSSFEERTRVREQSRATGNWPPKGPALPDRMENKLLYAAPFSPMQ